MNEKEKELLLKDLCARLPYRVKVRVVDNAGYEHILPIDGYLFGTIRTNGSEYDVSEIKLYLRPVSSLTEKEIDILFDILHIDKNGNDEDWIKINDALGIKFFLSSGRWIEEIDEALSYLRSIHIDIYNYIEKGLALEAPKDMYKTD